MMDRPYIFCHMLMSLDGKIVGKYMDKKNVMNLVSNFMKLLLAKMHIINIKGGFLEE